MKMILFSSEMIISESSIRNYIAKCSEISLRLNKSIQEKLSNKDKIIVQGVGTHTQRLIGADLNISKILFFVDSNARYRGKKIKGIVIKSHSDIKEEEIPILISNFSYQEEITYQIKEVLKLNNEIIKMYKQSYLIYKNTLKWRINEYHE